MFHLTLLGLEGSCSPTLLNPNSPLAFDHVNLKHEQFIEGS